MTVSQDAVGDKLLEKKFRRRSKTDVDATCLTSSTAIPSTTAGLHGMLLLYMGVVINYFLTWTEEHVPER